MAASSLLPAATGFFADVGQLLDVVQGVDHMQE
jgi:hypothetical protein